MKRSYLLVMLLVVGCGDPSAKLLKTKALDPAEVAKAAVAQYDTDGDGAISVAEAKASALDPQKGWDANGDKKISADEIRTRLEQYEQRKPGMMMLTCTVKYRGKPLDGAEVVFEPEEFLGGSIETATGTTDIYGGATLSIPEVVAKDPTLTGLRTGLYKVKITHPKLDIPAKFNESTTLTFEISPVENVLPPVFDLR